MVRQSEVFELLDYCGKTGAFRWRARDLSLFKSERAGRSWNQKYAGSVAGGVKSHGYRYITINYKGYGAHRLAWLYQHGCLPSNAIDHINGIRDDNRIANLRVVSVAENQRNQKMRKGNCSGVMGVQWHKDAGKWVARIGSKYIGLFSDMSEAIAARRFAERELGYHENHGRKI